MAETGQKSCTLNAACIQSTLLLIWDIIVMQVRFWTVCVQSFIKTVTKQEEISVQDQVVLITGTGHGIGKETALNYGKLGAKVICWDINEKNNAETVKEIKNAGGKAFGYTCNVVNREDINELADKIKKEHGFVSIIVNNAGIMPCHPLLQTSETEIKNMFSINVYAHFWIIQAFLPEMIEKNTGHIVALSSCAGLFGLPNLVPYCGTKFAVRGVMEALSAELHKLNPESKIKFTTIYPYMVDTGLCKKPRYRFPKLMKLVPVNEAAASIVNAQRTGLEEASIPRHFVYVDKIGRLMPKSAMRVINDFLDTYVESDL